MPESIKGINVVIGSDTTGLSKALSDVNKKSKDIQTELRQVERLLKLDPGNTELVAQKQKLLADAVSNTKDKLTSLKQVQEQVSDQLAKGTINEGQYRAFQREVAATEQGLKKLEAQTVATKKEFTVFGMTMQQTSEKLRTVGQNLSKSLSLPLGLAGAASLKLASDMEESINKVSVVFGASAKQIMDWSKDTISNIGLASGTALDASATFGDMATGMGMSQSEAANLSIGLVNLAGDLKSFKNVPIEQAMTALKGVFTGETESLKDLGIVMLDSQLKAYALEKGITTSYESMSQAEKVSLRYQFVLEKAKNSMGDFKNTAGSTSNQMSSFKENMKQLGETLGEQILPLFNPFVKLANTLLREFIALPGGVKMVIANLALFLIVLGPGMVIVSNFMTAIGWLVKSVTWLSDALKIASIAQAWHTVVTKAELAWIWIYCTAVDAAALATSLWAGAMAILTAPITLIILAIAAVVAAGYLLIKNWESIKQFGLDIWNGITDLIGSVLDGINEKFAGFKEFMVKVWEYVTAPIRPLINAIQWLFSVLDKGIEWLRRFFGMTEKEAEILVNDDQIKKAGENASGLDEALEKSRTKTTVPQVNAEQVVAATKDADSLNTALSKTGDEQTDISVGKEQIDAAGDSTGKLSTALSGVQESKTKVEVDYSSVQSAIAAVDKLVESISNIERNIKIGVATNGSLGGAPKAGMQVSGIASPLEQIKAAWGKLTGSGASAATTKTEVKHSGTVTVRGVNNQGETVGVWEQLMEGMRV